MNETLEIIQSEFAQASFETFEMVLISMIAAAILGTILGLVLHLASNPIFYKNRVVNGITGTIINVIRSLPFIILIIVLQLLPVRCRILHIQRLQASLLHILDLLRFRSRRLSDSSHLQ